MSQLKRLGNDVSDVVVRSKRDITCVVKKKCVRGRNDVGDVGVQALLIVF